MAAAAELVQMAKRPGRPKSDRDDVTIRVSRPFASKLKMLAGNKGISVAEMADELFETALDRAYAQLMRRLEGEE